MLPYIAIGSVVCLFIIDYLFLFLKKRGLFATRTHAERFSNGDDNAVRIDIESYYDLPVSVEIIDEIPEQFQRRDVFFKISIPAREARAIQYSLRPVKRGEYLFGTINVYISGPINFVKRRFRFQQWKMVPVYPSYIQMRKYQLLAIHDRLSEIGIR